MELFNAALERQEQNEVSTKLKDIVNRDDQGEK